MNTFQLQFNSSLQITITDLAKIFKVPQADLLVIDRHVKKTKWIAGYIDPNCVECLSIDSVMDQIEPIYPIIEWMEKLQKPLRVFDAQGDPRIEPIRDLMKQTNISSVMIVPVFSHVNDLLIGVIHLSVVGNRRRFTKKEAAVAQLVSNQIAISYENAILVEKLEIVSSFGNQIAALPSRIEKEDLVELIYELIIKIFPSLNVTITLYNPATMNVSYEFTNEDGRVSQLVSSPPNSNRHTKTDWIFANGKSILNRTSNESRAWYGPEVEWGLAPKDTPPSFLGVPMQLGQGKVIGVLTVSDIQHENAFDKIDQQILEALANQAALALENTELVGQLFQKTELLRTLNRVTHDISSTAASEASLVETLHDILHALTNANGILFAFYDNVSQQIRSIICQGDEHQRQLPIRILDGNSRDRIEEVILTGQPLLHRNREEQAAWYDQPNHVNHTNLGGESIGSMLIVPMTAEGQRIGAIAIFDTKNENIFNEIDIEFLSTIAIQAAIALVNARLYENNISLVRERNANEQLAVLGTAFAALQHRINNTFNVINPNISRLKSRIDVGNPEIAQIIDIIERNVRYTSELVARIQEPLKDQEQNLVNINAVLYDLSAKVSTRNRDQVSDANVQIVLNLDDSIPLIRASVGQISEVLRNLMENSCKAMKYDGQLTISSRQNNGLIEVLVSDTGPGIPPNVQEKLFVKPVPSTRLGGGSGLGLWLSGLILKQMGGALLVSKSDRTGTTMIVRIPTSTRE